MLVSILVPLFNKEDYIEKTILSVVSQTYEHWELIVVDDGSTDLSLNRVLDLKSALDLKVAKQIRILRQSNLGQSIARSVALENARGDFIALLDADDLWSPKKLEKQVRFLQANSSIDLVLSNYCIFPENGASPKAISFSHTKRRVLGWAKFEYFGGLVESTGLFRAEFLRRYMRPEAPAMTGGLEICLRAMQLNSIDCVDDYLCAYVENVRGWHMRKDDLSYSIMSMSEDIELEETTRRDMVRGLNYHLFFWRIRNETIMRGIVLIVKLVIRFKHDYFVFVYKTLSRDLVARMRYFFIRGKIQDLKALL